MSDSIRDQLLKAGFSQSKQEKPGKKQRHRKPKAASTQPEPNMSIEEARAAAKLANKSASKAAARQRYMSVSPQTAAQKNKTRKAPAVKPKAGGWGARSLDSSEGSQKYDQKSANDTQALNGKSEIEVMILADALKAFGGAEVYRFTLRNKIRELHVSEPVRQQLVEGQLAITRLNEATHLIPADTAVKIQAINPQWVLYIATKTDAQDTADYDDFPVPDDLIW